VWFCKVWGKRFINNFNNIVAFPTGGRWIGEAKTNEVCKAILLAQFLILAFPVGEGGLTVKVKTDEARIRVSEVQQCKWLPQHTVMLSEVERSDNSDINAK
jgi:hypothetical protein